jgi:hypothetical protein
MTSPVNPVHALKAEIADLKFKMEIWKHSDWDIGIDELIAEKNTREAQISVLQGRLDELMSALHTTEGMDFLIDDQNMRPLISTLPYEMLSAVFKKAPMDPFGRVPFTRSVSQVSHYWRKTAMQTPFLWSGIPTLPWRIGIGYQEFLNVLIQQSRSHALNIAISLRETENSCSLFNRQMAVLDATRHESSTNSEELAHHYEALHHPEVEHCLQAQLGIFADEVSRWRSFTYHCDCSDDIREITEPLANMFAPILESFKLSVLQPYDRENDIEPRNIFTGGAPILSCVKIGGVVPVACLPPLAFVKSLHLDAGVDQVDGVHFLHILRSSLVLVSLQLEGTIVPSADLYQLAL